MDRDTGRAHAPRARAIACPAGVAAVGRTVERRRRERRRERRFVLTERRSGYDRRGVGHAGAHQWAHRLREAFAAAPWLLPGVLVAANVLSLMDMLLTLRILEAGGIEVNPFLAALLERDVRLAAGVKLSLVAGATLLIWRYRGHRRILPLALVAFGLFAAVVMYQAALLAA